MTRVLSPTELREILDLLIPIIRHEGPFKVDPQAFAWSVMESSAEKAKQVWKLLTYEDYAGELV